MALIAASSIVVVRGGQFLLVRRGRGMAKGRYAFPGGRREPAETGAMAAIRELAEETGLIASAMTLVRTIQLDARDDIFELDVFFAAEVAGSAQAGDDAEAIGWYTIDAMRDLDITESTLEIAEELAAAGFRPPSKLESGNTSR